MKLALLLPGYLDSPDYFHLKYFDEQLQKLGYTVERLDLCDLWRTGDTEHYSVTASLSDVQERIEYYRSQQPTEILLVGHSMGGFLALIAGNKISEVSHVVALCPPADKKSSVHKWVNGVRKSKRDLPGSPTEFRTFAVPKSYLDDAMLYSPIDAVAQMNKPVMLLIAEQDLVVAPAETERIVAAAHDPFVVRMSNMGHDFRQSAEQCELVWNEIRRFIQQQNKL